MNDIVAVCDTQNMNKIAFATAIFVPSQEKSWGQAAIFNTECQKLNESMNIPRVNLHRSVMSQISAWNLTMRIRPAMFSQFQLGCGLGTHLSHEGQEHVKRYVIKVFDTVFSQTEPIRKGKPPRVTIPPSLAVTSGYMDNDFMYQLMQEKGIVAPRSRSTGGDRSPRLKCTDQRLAGWRQWQFYKDHGPLWRFNCREGILEAHRLLVTKSDNKPTWGNSEEGQVEDKNVESSDESSDESSEESSDDSVFELSVEPVPVRPIARDSEKQKGKKNSIESEDSTTKMLRIAYDKVKEGQRALEIANEKIKAYKRDLDKKEEALVKERAATKNWREMAENNLRNNDNLNVEMYKLESKVKKLEDECDRWVEEYDYLREECDRKDDERKAKKDSKSGDKKRKK